MKIVKAWRVAKVIEMFEFTGLMKLNKDFLNTLSHKTELSYYKAQKENPTKYFYLSLKIHYLKNQGHRR